jgi:hypothetical protein
MYLYLGKNTSVRISSIVAVFDLDTSSHSQQTRNYLYEAERAGLTVDLCDDLPKSFVICDEDGKNIVYLCQLASATLQKRLSE